MSYPGPAGAQAAGWPATAALAPRWRRLLAWLLDSAILTGLTAPIWTRPFAVFLRRLRNLSLFYPSLSAPGASTAVRHAELDLLGSLLLALALTSLIALAYYWIQYAAWGRTIGKRAVGTVVVAADGRSKVGGSAAGIRSAVFVLVPDLLMLFFVLDGLWLLWDPQRQCLHDKAAGTLVVLS
ncbi:MAG TPA: RDD family protein [Streptosporangiaceae bacterium]